MDLVEFKKACIEAARNMKSELRAEGVSTIAERLWDKAVGSLECRISAILQNLDATKAIAREVAEDLLAGWDKGV
jgi:hypothetical protein